MDHERNYENNDDQDPTDNMLDVENVDQEMAENISEVYRTYFKLPLALV